MAHPKLQLSRLLDWLKLRIECEDTAPTDEQIVDYLGLDSISTAKSMLADLADRGDITMGGAGADRTIALGRRHREIETVRPTPSVARPARKPISEEEGVARIRAILARTPKTTTSPAAEMEAPASGEGERQDETIVHEAKATSTPEAAPPSFAPKRLPTAPDRRVVYDVPAARQVNVRLDEIAFAEIKRRANGRSVTGTATAILSAALRGDVETIEHAPARFSIPAAVTSAALRDGIPVLDLAATLMIKGLQSYEQGTARERAA